MTTTNIMMVMTMFTTMTTVMMKIIKETGWACTQTQTDSQTPVESKVNRFSDIGSGRRLQRRNASYDMETEYQISLRAVRQTRPDP